MVMSISSSFIHSFIIHSFIHSFSGGYDDDDDGDDDGGGGDDDDIDFVRATSALTAQTWRHMDPSQ